MALYSVVSKQSDAGGRVWLSYFKVRAVGINHALDKASDILDSVGIGYLKINVRPSNQPTASFTGKTGCIQRVGRDEPDGSPFDYTQRLNVVNGEWQTASDMSLTEMDFVLSRVWGRL